VGKFEEDSSVEGGELRPGYKILLLALLLHSFGGTVFNRTETLSQEFDSVASNAQKRFTIASYNLGSANLKDPETLRKIADNISRFETTALQCVRDVNAEADLYELVAEMNRQSGQQYEYVLGPSIGAVPSRYAFIYRTDIMYPVQWYSYDDSSEDDFSWEPFAVRFEIDGDAFDFTLINYYTEPESRPMEIDLLSLVIDDVKARFPDEADIIILCSAKTDDNTNPVSDPFRSLEQRNYILLLDAMTSRTNDLDVHIDPQIIIAASSEEMFWEDVGLLAIEAESSTRDNTGTNLSTSQPGFSTFIVVNSEPEDTDDKNEGSKSKAGCFFSTASN
jgi:hypothetical protein